MNIIQLHRATLVDAPACSGGGCRQGDYPHLCDCELSNAVPMRVEFPAPPPRLSFRAIFWRSYFGAIVSIAALSALLACWPE